MKTKTKLIFLAILLGVVGLVFGYVGGNADVEEVEQEREDTTIILPETQEEEEPLIDVESELTDTELEEVEENQETVKEMQEETENYGEDLDTKI